jgi:hypothetical protein
MMVTGGFALFALLVAWVVIPAATRRDQRETPRWAAAEGVRLDATTEPAVTAYLRTRRNLRQIGAVGGLLVAPAVTAGTGIDLQVPGLVWFLTGYLLGCLWAELALTRRSGAVRRSASLRPRRLGDYLPAGMLRAQVAAPAAVLVLGVVCGWLIDPDIDPLASGWAVGAEPEVLRRGAVLAGGLGVASMAGILAAQRLIIRRPQPFTDPDHVAVDDALRSSSARLLGGTGIAVVGVLAATQLSYLAVAAEGAASGLAGVSSLVVLLTSLLQWRWWPHRGWRVRRAPVSPPTSALPVPAGHASGGDHG